MIKHNTVKAGAFGNGKPDVSFYVFEKRDLTTDVLDDFDVIDRSVEFHFQDKRMISIPKSLIDKKYKNLINP